MDWTRLALGNLVVVKTERRNNSKAVEAAVPVASSDGAFWSALRCALETDTWSRRSVSTEELSGTTRVGPVQARFCTCVQALVWDFVCLHINTPVTIQSTSTTMFTQECCLLVSLFALNPSG